MNLLASCACMAQFPGYMVQHFNSENGMQNTIKGIQPDKNGFVWLATESGLVRYDGQHFKHFNLSESGEEVNRLVEIGLTKTGGIYVQKSDDRYFYLDANNRLQPIAGNSLYKDNDHEEYSIRKRVKLYNSISEKNSQHQLNAVVVPDFVRTNRLVFKAFACSKGYFFYLNSRQELVAADTSLQKFEKLDLPLLRRKTNGVTLSSKLSLFQNSGQVYVRCLDSLYALSFRKDLSNIRLEPVLYVGDILDIIGFLPVPAANLSIIATLADGIYVFKKQQFNALLLPDSEPSILYAQAAFGEDGVLTHRGMVSPKSFRPLKEKFSPIAILKRQDGSYYLQLQAYEQFMVSRLGSNLELLNNIPCKHNLIRCFSELNSGEILVATDSLFLGKLSDSGVQWLARPPGIPDNFDIVSILQTGKDQLWLGGNNGLFVYNTATQETQQITGLEKSKVRSLFRDDKGTTWIGTYGNGFYAWYNNKLITLPQDPSRYLQYVHTFMPDKSGCLWISTNHGLFNFRMQDLYGYLDKKQQSLYYDYYDHTAGFNTNEFNGGCNPAGIVLGNGKFSLPSLKGLVQFYPDSIERVFPGNSFFIDDIIADSSALKIDVATLTIPANTHHLKLIISTPYFGNSYNQNIEYQLDNDAPWYKLNDEGIIELNDPKVGGHNITLRKLAGFGADQYITKKIFFTVAPRFFETGIFKVAIALCLAAMLYLLYRIRLNFLLKQKKFLQQEVAAKTQEQLKLIDTLEETVLELEQSRDSLEQAMLFKETLALIIAHDLQSPLRFLTDAMERFNEHNTKDATLEYELSRELQKTSANIYHFVQDFLIWIRKANLDKQIAVEPVNMQELLAEMNSFFCELAKSRGNKIVLEVAPALQVYGDYQLLKIIIRNIIDNANKHTSQGTITIAITADEQLATIEVIDNGCGIRPETLQKLRQYTQQRTALDIANKNNLGYGYRFVTDFCRLLGLSLSINSKPQAGTTVSISGLKIVPLTNNIQPAQAIKTHLL